jgi:hypothetical protein
LNEYFFLFKYIMAKHRSQKRRSHSKRRTRRHRQHGGNYPSSDASAWNSVYNTVGDGWTQFQNSLMLQPGENLGASQSNALVPIGNPNAQTSQGNIGPNMTGNVPGQLGGRRRRRRKSRGKRGGNLLTVAQQAAVPVALIAMNNAYGKRSRSHRRR